MIVGDVVRGLLFLSIPLFPNLTWIFIAKFLAGCASLFWTPAKDASVPNLVPPDRLERANQLSLFTTYGSAVVAGSRVQHARPGEQRRSARSRRIFNDQPVESGALLQRGDVRCLRAHRVLPPPHPEERPDRGHISAPSVARTIWEGWRFLGQTPGRARPRSSA